MYSSFRSANWLINYFTCRESQEDENFKHKTLCTGRGTLVNYVEVQTNSVYVVEVLIALETEPKGIQNKLRLHTMATLNFKIKSLNICL
jgi:hypothetical protein